MASTEQNTLPVQMARDIAAQSSTSNDPDYLRFMREGAYDHNEASVRAALLGILAGRAIPADSFTPEDLADLFYAQDDRFQAGFYNAMQDRVLLAHRSGVADGAIGVPAGEPQWYAAMRHLTDQGFATIEAMYQHACDHRGIDLADAA